LVDEHDQDGRRVQTPKRPGGRRGGVVIYRVDRFGSAVPAGSITEPFDHLARDP
jgi:hypothetical protein